MASRRAKKRALTVASMTLPRTPDSDGAAADAAAGGALDGGVGGGGGGGGGDGGGDGDGDGWALMVTAGLLVAASWLGFLNQLRDARVGCFRASCATGSLAGHRRLSVARGRCGRSRASARPPLDQHKTPAQEARRRLAQRRRDDVAPNPHLLGCPQKAQTKAEDDAARDVVEIDRAVHEASRGHSCARRPAPTPAAPPPAEPMRVRKAAPCTAASGDGGWFAMAREARTGRAREPSIFWSCSTAKEEIRAWGDQ